MSSVSPQKGIRSFFTIWAGQLISVTGTGLTGFALAVWVYQQTGSVTQYSFIALATTLPGIVLSPLAGTLVDRWDRRWMMILGDSGSAFATLVISLLLFSGSLRIWHLLLLLSVSSSCVSLQSPAYAASVPMLVPKERLGNYNGLIQLGQAIPKVIAPVLAGVLVAWIHIWGVIAIDFATFLFSVVALLLVRIPRPAPSAAVQEGWETGKASLWREVGEGWNYLKSNPGLLSILLFFSVTYFSIGVVNVSGPALVLSFASAPSLGAVLSLASVGFIGGSIVMSVWGGPKHRIYGVLGFTLPFGLGILLAGVYPSMILIAIAIFLITFTAPLIFGCSDALWQSKVPPNLQGRVFTFRDMVVRSALPLAYVVSGPLADRVFEPLLKPRGPLAGTVGRIIGVGPGRGVGLMFVVFGGLSILAALGGYLVPRVRRVDEEIPDALPSSESESVEPVESLAGELVTARAHS